MGPLKGPKPRDGDSRAKLASPSDRMELSQPHGRRAKLAQPERSKETRRVPNPPRWDRSSKARPVPTRSRWDPGRVPNPPRWDRSSKARPVPTRSRWDPGRVPNPPRWDRSSKARPVPTIEWDPEGSQTPRWDRSSKARPVPARFNGLVPIDGDAGVPFEIRTGPDADRARVHYQRFIERGGVPPADAAGRRCWRRFWPVGRFCQSCSWLM